MPTTDRFVRELCVTDAQCVEFAFVVTSKGNGTLSFPGGWIRIFDSHVDDDDEMPPELSENALVDMNNDGFKDVKTDIVVFLFDPHSGCFVPPTDPLAPVLFGRAPCDFDDE